MNNCMEQSPSETASCALAQEFHNILWNLKVHYRVHKSPPLVLILSQINPVRTTTSSLRSVLILSTHLRVGLLSGLFWLFHQNPTCTPLSPHSCYMPFRSLPRLVHSDDTWWRVQVMKLLIMQFPPVSHHFISLRSKYSSRHPQSVFLP
jgi:hypothetical protein